HIQGHVPWQAGAAIGVFARPSPVTCHDLAKRLPRQGASELEERVGGVDSDRNDCAIFGWSWAEPKRTMVLLFHDRLLRCKTCADTQTYQKEQRLFNPRRAHRAPWVGSAHRDSQPPLRDTLYISATLIHKPGFITCYPMSVTLRGTVIFLTC